MVTGDRRSMASGHISQITPSKYFLQALCSTGVLSMFLYRITLYHTNSSDTTDVKQSPTILMRLDAPRSRRRSHEKTKLLIKCFDPGILWKEFGIRSDVKVSYLSPWRLVQFWLCTISLSLSIPRADIHKLLSPDLLHQVIKGTFKDHVVAWVNKYLVLTHGESKAKEFIDDIDRRWVIIVTFPRLNSLKFFRASISAVPQFPGLQWFPEGRDFHQWTGDDSKALMKVSLLSSKSSLQFSVHLQRRC